ncbi:MAG: ComF family protein [Cyclobacteriaceae bacterium]|nr:ComF family protein [Cyclobacteriaceae bacterium]
MFHRAADIINLVFPKTCAGCSRTLLNTEKTICLHCLSNLPVRLSLNSEELMQRFYGRLDLEEAHAFLLFKRKGLTQNLLHAIKYKSNQELAVELGLLFGIQSKALSMYSNVDLIVPVPLHKSKLRFRGFNQSALIAEGISKGLHKPYNENCMIRKVKTATQTKKNRMERWKNVDNIFQANPAGLKDKHILLVDDVITTGATLESCGQAILDSGAKKLSIACLALA